MRKRANRPAVSSKLCLAIRLRILSGESYSGAMIGFEVGLSTIYSIFYDTSLALMKVLCLTGLPNTWDALQKLSMIFKYSRKRVRTLPG